MEQEKYSEAEVAIKEAIALNPQDYKNRMSYGTLGNLGSLLIATDQYQVALMRTSSLS